ncbi:hypothetical protein [Micromonospora sp. WMMD737]|uniref:hypothetical protein n=1 Tax=Micromonospora sp. WMMD737 TaxID=3404113 RepID=UPI003B92B6DF
MSANPVGLIVAWLPAHLTAPKPTVGEDLPTRLTAGLRQVAVNDAGGPGDQVLTLDVADVDVDCFADDRDAARDLGEECRRALRRLLPGTSHGGVFVKDVLTLARPALIPYDVPVIRRCTASYRLTLHTD